MSDERDGLTVDESDMPGTWTHADIIGGDPDERSYAERGWAPTEKAILCGPKPPTKGDLEKVAEFALFLADTKHLSMPPPVICPECAQGKHANCTGDALDESTDSIVDCQCPRCV